MPGQSRRHFMRGAIEVGRMRRAIDADDPQERMLLDDFGDVDRSPPSTTAGQSLPFSRLLLLGEKYSFEADELLADVGEL